MQYRTFGKTGIQISTFGLGCMRLPILDGDSAKIDEPEAIRMIRYAVDNGVNYIDTAFPYHQGNSEYVVGKALKDGYRERVQLATKLPCWLVNSTEDFDKYLNEQLKKLDTDHIDFYLLHGLGADQWERMKKLGAVEFLNRAKADGRIKYACFSFHDDLPAFKKIIDENDWDMAQIQLNYADENNQAGVEGLKYAHEKGVPVVIMEPLKGGSLSTNVPDEVMEVWNKAKTKRNPAGWAFSWLCNMPEVTVVLSGSSTMEQLKDGMENVSSVLPGSLSAEELKLIEEAKAIYEARTKVGCTACRYCMPCPMGVKIPEIFHIYNEAAMFINYDQSKMRYNNLGDGKATACAECGACESACPQHLPIIEKLKEAHADLS